MIAPITNEEKQKLFGIHHKWTVTLDEKRKLALESLEQGPSWLYKNKQRSKKKEI